MTSQRTRILRILDALGEAGGLEIVRSSAGLVGRIPVYGRLAELEEAGLVVSRYIGRAADPNAPRRKVYRLTGTGEREARSG